MPIMPGELADASRSEPDSHAGRADYRRRGGPRNGPEGVRTPGLVSPVGSEEWTLGARLGHVRFAPILAVLEA